MSGDRNSGQKGVTIGTRGSRPSYRTARAIDLGRPGALANTDD
ncbi:MAG: hypothetical protein ACRDWI_09460 [Jiangellaceae bacterium]